MDMVLIVGIFAFQVYFSNTVDTSVARYGPAQGEVELGSVYIQAFQSAQTSVDVCIYSINRSDITNALIEAHNRGVQVRVIADYNNYFSSDSVYFQAMQDAGIPVLHSAAGLNTTHTMHNKYAVIDNAKVITGSFNFSSSPGDANHVVVMEDTALAAVFREDFEEMWGSTGPLPDTMASRTGTRKQTPAVHYLTVGGHDVYVFFSPQDPFTVLDTFLSVISQRQTHIVFEQWRFTYTEIADSFQRVWQRRGIVGGLVDVGSWDDNPARCMRGDVACSGPPWDPPAWVLPDNVSGRLHHKVGVFDDQWVAFGSTNWSYNGFFSNDENMVLVLNDTLADAFLQEIAARWREAGGGSSYPGHVKVASVQAPGASDSSALVGRKLGGIWTVAADLGDGLYGVVDSFYAFPWQGVVIQVPPGSSPLLPGSRIDVHGWVVESLRTTMVQAETILVDTLWDPPPNPWPVSSLGSLLQEAYEGVWVQVGPLTVTSVASGRFTVTDGSDSMVVGGWRSWSGTMPRVGDFVILRGILFQDLSGWSFQPALDGGVVVSVEETGPKHAPSPKKVRVFDVLGRRVRGTSVPGVVVDPEGHKRVILR